MLFWHRGLHARMRLRVGIFNLKSVLLEFWLNWPTFLFWALNGCKFWRFELGVKLFWLLNQFLIFVFLRYLVKHRLRPIHVFDCDVKIFTILNLFILDRFFHCTPTLLWSLFNHALKLLQVPYRISSPWVNRIFPTERICPKWRILHLCDLLRLISGSIKIFNVFNFLNHGPPLLQNLFELTIGPFSIN